MTDPEVGKQQNIFRYRSYRRIVVPTKDIKKGILDSLKSM